MTILAITSLTGMLSPLTGNIYLPALNQIQSFSIHYGLSDLQIGLCFLCTSVGTIVGANVEGRLIDCDYKINVSRYEKTHLDANEKNIMGADFPIFHARFRTVWIHVVIVQVLTILYGWCFIPNASLAVILIIQFIVAVSSVGIITCAQTLLIDLYPTKGASISASNSLIRCILGAIATVFIDSGIEGVGTGWLFTIVSLILVISNVSLPILIKYGPRWKNARIEKEK